MRDTERDADASVPPIPVGFSLKHSPNLVVSVALLRWLTLTCERRSNVMESVDCVTAVYPIGGVPNVLSASSTKRIIECRDRCGTQLGTELSTKVPVERQKPLFHTCLQQRKLH